MKRTHISALVTLLFLGGLAIGAHGQRNSAKAPQQATLVAVHVSGSERFKEEDIVAATGLTVGATAGPTEFQEAANKLVACGAFESVEYKFGPAGAGYNVTFKVADNAGFMPVSYENFVWFTEKELNDAVQKKVPLFDGAVASGGEMLDQVKAALQAFITEHGINGDVTFMQTGGLGTSIEGGVFTIEGPTVHIKQVKFPGAGEAEGPALEKVGALLTKAPYRRSIATAFAELNLRPVYRERGYLKAEFAAPQIELVDKNAQDPAITLTIPVTPGIQYKIDTLEVKGGKAFPADIIIKTMKMRAAETANAVQLDKDAEALVTLYGTKGYLRATAKPEYTFDDAKRTVLVVLRVTEGEVYHMREVDVTGMDKQSNALLREAWKLREGEPYNTSYEREFFTKTVRSMLPPNVSVELNKTINDESHTVDLDMTFKVHADKVIREQ